MTHVGLLPLAAVASHEDLAECPAKWIPKKPIKLAKLTHFTNLDFLEIRGFPSSATFGVRSCEVAMSRKSFGSVVISHNKPESFPTCHILRCWTSNLRASKTFPVLIGALSFKALGVIQVDRAPFRRWEIRNRLRAGKAVADVGHMCAKASI